MRIRRMFAAAIAVSVGLIAGCAGATTPTAPSSNVLFGQNPSNFGSAGTSSEAAVATGPTVRALSDPTGDPRNSCPDSAVTWQTRHIDLEDGTEHVQSWAPMHNIDTYIVHKVFRGSTGTRTFPPHAQNGTSYRILATEGEGWYDLYVQVKNRCDKAGVMSEVRRTGLGKISTHEHGEECWWGWKHLPA